MRDKGLVARMIAQCREAVLCIDDLRYKNKAEKIVDLIVELKAKKGVVSNSTAISKVLLRYHEEMDRRYLLLWQRQRLRGSLVSGLKEYPWLLKALRKVKRLVL